MVTGFLEKKYDVMILWRFIYVCGKFHTDTINQTVIRNEFVKLVWGKWKLFRATLRLINQQCAINIISFYFIILFISSKNLHILQLDWPADSNASLGRPVDQLLTVCLLYSFAIKVAQNSFQHFPRRRFWWVIITTFYQLMLQSWY